MLLCDDVLTYLLYFNGLLVCTRSDWRKLYTCEWTKFFFLNSVLRQSPLQF